MKMANYTLYNFVILCFQLFGVVLALISYTKLKTSKNFLDNLMYNWNLTPIKRIVITENDCQDNFEQFSVEKYHYTCNRIESKNFLSTVLQESNYLLDYYNQTVCAERMQNFNYFNYISKFYNNDKFICEKNCGVIDSLNNPYCVGKNEPCPINLIDFVKRNDINNATFNQTFLNINSNFYMKVENNSQNIISENKKVAVSLKLIEDKYNMTHKCKNSLKFRFDTNIINIELKIKNITKKMHITDYNAKYDIVQFNGWKKECFFNWTKSPEILAFFLNDYNEVYSNSESILFHFIIFTLIIILLLYVYIPLKFKPKEKFFSPYLFIFLINSFFMVVTINKIFSNINTSWKIIYSKSINDTYPVEKCSDDAINSEFLQLKNSINSILLYDTIIFYGQFINWTVPLYILIVIHIKKQKH